MSIKAQNTIDPWLHRFAVLTAIMTFLLLGLGGLVTSHEAGMSVPDWPTSLHRNMFLLPTSEWTGGIFYEHTHRLLASSVGLFTTVLAFWLWLKDPRKWMHWLGIAAFLGVIAQGILGGLRVRWHLDWLGVPHAAVAQMFLVLTCALAFFTSRFWFEFAANNNKSSVSRGLRSHVLFVTILIFLQLVLGATMRHQHAGLAIPDFPAAYGKIWPDTSPVAVAHYNAQRMDVNGENPITVFQIVLQMLHRLAAIAIFAGVASAAWLSRKRLGGADALTKFAWLWLALIVVQILLGAWTVWSNKAADVATAHVLIGALSLVIGAFWCILGFRHPLSLSAAVPPAKTSDAFAATPALAANR